MKRWIRFAYICDVDDVAIHIRRNMLEPDEVNAASNTTIIIERMLRRGRLAGRAMRRGYNDNGSKP